MYTAISVNEFLTKNGIPLVPQPPYSPDLSPWDFVLFPKLKFHLILELWTTSQLRALPHEDFQHCYREWEQRSGGVWLPKGTNYFEGDNVDL